QTCGGCPSPNGLIEHLGDMLEVGSGGFGRVYKARHKDWGFDVAVKILKEDASHYTFKEGSFMDLASCEFVLRVHGVYKGPLGERGLVTDYMSRGSIESLQTKLSGPPPWPLAFQLAHQTALAMNFLHHKNIVHLDLKPNNILLNDELNVRLADFGLSTVSKSVVSDNRNSHTGPQGTLQYMPPEAFDLSYNPVRAFDIYSFSILLWSIFSGKEPYPGYSIVKARITEGDRPDCKDLLSLNVDGIRALVDLMKRCWEGDPDKRPYILKTTEELFSRHSDNIRRAVDEVLINWIDQIRRNHIILSHRMSTVVITALLTPLHKCCTIFISILFCFSFNWVREK
uniref:Protein kinase domain-containing protein n=1 Tax=Neogobius melanostomus TaxID=47308 RepID=A0A8C6WGQ6_9GOBI